MMSRGGGHLARPKVLLVAAGILPALEAKPPFNRGLEASATGREWLKFVKKHYPPVLLH
jgi:hypothetical protein